MIRKKVQQLGSSGKELVKDQVTIELLSYDDGTAKKIADYVKDQIEKNLKGVTINTKIQPFKQKLKLETAQDYEISYAGWSPTMRIQ